MPDRRRLLRAAVEHLVSEDAPLQERLEHAWINHVERLRPEDFPEAELAERFRSVRERLGVLDVVVGESEEAALGAVRALAPERQRELARAVLELYEAVLATG